MKTQSTQDSGNTMETINPSSIPQFVLNQDIMPQGALPSDASRFPFSHDFILNGRPQKFLRTARGNFSIADGSIVQTPYGVGKLINQNKVAITEFVSQDAKEDIKRASDAYNTMVMMESAKWERFIETNEDNGIATPSALRKDIKELIEMKLSSLLDDNEINIGASHVELISGSALYKEVSDPRQSNDSIKDKNVRRRLRKEAARLLAKTEEEDNYIPDEIKEEIGYTEYNNQ